MAEEKEAQAKSGTRISPTTGIIGTGEQLSRTAQNYGRILAETVTQAHDVGTLAENALEIDQVSAWVDECLADVERAREKMSRDQNEIDRLKSETRIMIARLLAA